MTFGRLLGVAFLRVPLGPGSPLRFARDDPFYDEQLLAKAPLTYFTAMRKGAMPNTVRK